MDIILWQTEFTNIFPPRTTVFKFTAIALHSYRDMHIERVVLSMSTYQMQTSFSYIVVTFTLSICYSICGAINAEISIRGFTIIVCIPRPGRKVVNKT